MEEDISSETVVPSGIEPRGIASLTKSVIAARHQVRRDFRIG